MCLIQFFLLAQMHENILYIFFSYVLRTWETEYFYTQSEVYSRFSRRQINVNVNFSTLIRCRINVDVSFLISIQY